MLGFVLKKLVSRLLFPLPACLLLLAAGLGFLLCSRRRRTGLVLAGIGLALLTAAGYGVPARALLQRLEWRHLPPAPEQTVRQLTNTRAGALWIVVLGSGMSEDERLPATTRLDPHIRARVVEGVRLLRQDSEAMLILSLPGRLPVTAKEAVLADLCRTLGIAQERVRLVTTARDTEDEARLVAGITAGAPLVLVTSAAHMSRAMMLFRGAGMDPAASPTDYLTPRPGAPGEFHPASLYPSAESLCLSERAAYEYLGIAWARVRGQTRPQRAPAPAGS